MAAGVLAILACVARMFPLLDPSRFDPTPSVIHPPRETDEVLDAIDGPILVTVDYLVPVDKAEVFRESMRAVARVPKAHRRATVGALLGSRGPPAVLGDLLRAVIGGTPATASRAHDHSGQSCDQKPRLLCWATLAR